MSDRAPASKQSVLLFGQQHTTVETLIGNASKPIYLICKALKGHQMLLNTRLAGKRCFRIIIWTHVSLVQMLYINMIIFRKLLDPPSLQFQFRIYQRDAFLTTHFYDILVTLGCQNLSRIATVNTHALLMMSCRPQITNTLYLLLEIASKRTFMLPYNEIVAVLHLWPQCSSKARWWRNSGWVSAPSNNYFLRCDGKIVWESLWVQESFN